ncbi:hypothetical protein PUN28_016194 [Cardiocondyla obscurior]|uniref:Uncharacterized protein n=1 Tax=Cardiocondyla obscurior TaxID=286306 RepID=A0AAW2EV22_9HYME
MSNFVLQIFIKQHEGFNWLPDREFVAMLFKYLENLPVDDQSADTADDASVPRTSRPIRGLILVAGSAE